MLWILNSILLGIGLAMDAFAVSVANGLHETDMQMHRQLGIAGIFAGFQGLMPMLGWICVHTVMQLFSAFSGWVPWISLILLCVLGGKMVIEGLHALRSGRGDSVKTAVSFGALLVQGTATSIDALSVGFTIADASWIRAVMTALIIAAVTFGICFCGVKLGKRAGTKLADKATVLGGLLLIGIGLEIFLSHKL